MMQGTRGSWRRRWAKTLAASDTFCSTGASHSTSTCRQWTLWTMPRHTPRTAPTLDRMRTPWYRQEDTLHSVCVHAYACVGMWVWLYHLHVCRVCVCVDMCDASVCIICMYVVRACVSVNWMTTCVHVHSTFASVWIHQIIAIFGFAIYRRMLTGIHVGMLCAMCALGYMRTDCDQSCWWWSKYGLLLWQVRIPDESDGPTPPPREPTAMPGMFIYTAEGVLRA